MHSSIPWLTSPEQLSMIDLIDKPDGIIAASKEISAKWLFHSYPLGIFPWYSEPEPVLWWSPNPRAVLFLENLKIHRSLHKTIRKIQSNKSHQITLNHAFETVIDACSTQVRPAQHGTWIGRALKSAYIELHHMGMTHSIEHWQNEQLIGGLYCVAIGGMVFGESMFSRQTDASKVAFAYFTAWLKQQNVHIIDCQQATRHLISFGATEISKSAFEQKLKTALICPALDWTPRILSWNP